MRHFRLYLEDILSAMNSIADFITGMNFEKFFSDDKTSSAVIRKLEIIGEAAKGIPDNIRAQYPQIPWKEMAGMRDRLIHFYFGTDFDLVWKTVTDRIPAVKPLVENMLREIKPEQ